MNMKEVTDTFGVTKKFLRYYENEGLLTPARTDHGGLTFRDYSDADLEKLALLIDYRSMGFSIGEIREILDQEDDRTGRLMAISLVEKKIQHLQEVEERLKHEYDHPELID